MADSSIVLILAVVGGYAFTLNYFPTQQRTLRSTGYALFYRSVFWGYVFFHASCLVLFIIRENGGLGHAWYFWTNKENLTAEIEFFAVLSDSIASSQDNLIAPSLLALWMGLLISFPLNAIVTKKLKANIIAKSSSQLERILTSSLVNRQMLLITLDSGKVYAGWVIKTPDVGDNNSDPGSGFKLLAFRSGYRCTETQAVVFTTDYEWLFDEDQSVSVDQLSTFVPLNRVVAITNFDPDLFDEFAKQSTKAIAKQPEKKHQVEVSIAKRVKVNVGPRPIPPDWKTRLQQQKRKNTQIRSR